MTSIKDPEPNNSITRNNSLRLFPSYLLWFVALPALPFLFSVAALSFFIEPSPAPNEIFISR